MQNNHKYAELKCNVKMSQPFINTLANAEVHPQETW